MQRLIGFLSLGLIASTLQAAEPLHWEIRVSQLEKQITNLTQTLLDHELRIGQQQREIQSLRGDKEILLHQFEQAQKQQQAIFLDLDDRLQALQGKTTSPNRVPETSSESNEAQIGDQNINPDEVVIEIDDAETGQKEASLDPPTDTTTASKNISPEEKSPSPISKTTELEETPRPSSPDRPQSDLSTTEKQLADKPAKNLEGGAQFTFSGQEDADYEKIAHLISNGAYSQAIMGFEAFIKQYPNGNQTNKAYYWLGELQFSLQKHAEALTTLKNLLERDPNGAKSPQILLRISEIYQEQKQYEDARTVLKQLQDTYPNTATAQLAEERLQQLYREGN